MWEKRRNVPGTAALLCIHAEGTDFPEILKMNTSRWLMAAAAVALVAGTSTSPAQQEPPRSAPSEKAAPTSPRAGAKTPAVPGANASGALKHGAAPPNRKKTAVEHGEGNRTGELQDNLGRSKTTGQAPGEPNRDTDEKK